MRLLLIGAAIGFLAYAFRQPLRGADVADDVLITRIRMKLDELLEQPGSVNIEVHGGRVRLTGPACCTPSPSRLQRQALTFTPPA